MSRPDWCPLWAWDEADRICLGFSFDDVALSIFQERVARALLAAEQRGRKAGLEEAAKVAGADDGNAPGGFGNPDFGPNVARRITAAIRSLGDKT